MYKYKVAIFYVTAAVLLLLVLIYMIPAGILLQAEKVIVPLYPSEKSQENFFLLIFRNLQNPLSVLLTQIVLIILVARICGWVFKKLGQPVVMGEIIAGIVLGPSIIGYYFPDLMGLVFPENSLNNLHLVSQIGLMLFMFSIGLGLDLRVLRAKAGDAIIIGHASAIIPFISGFILAWFLYQPLAPANVSFLFFALFFSISMSISAFPVLARIALERGIHRTKTGTIVMACAASNDLLVWSLLAVIISIIRSGSLASASYTLIFGVLYIFLMFKLVRPFLQRVGDLHPTRESITKTIVSIFFFTLLLSSLIAELIGIHALFGAFLAGAIMPENSKFRSLLIEKIEDIAVVLLLPLFFVSTGLRTQIGLIDDPELWKITGLIILVAIAGKLLGTTLVARIFGQDWKDSLILGTLMNTRGLMVLIVLNIGYDLGIFSPEVFTILVIMALFNTLLTSPLLSLINRIFKATDNKVASELIQTSKYNVLFSFANPSMGRSLLRLAHGFVKSMNENATITAMHLAPSSEFHQYSLKEYEEKIFEEVIDESTKLNQKFSTFFKASGDIEYDITEIVNKGNYDLLLIGLGQSIYEGNLLGKVLGFTTRIISPDKIINQVLGKESLFGQNPFNPKNQMILSRSNVTVGILIDKGLTNTNRIIFPVMSDSDILLVKFAQKLIKNSNAQITIIDLVGALEKNIPMKESIKRIEQVAPNHINILAKTPMSADLLSQHSLMLISESSWIKAVESSYYWLKEIPSTLIISVKSER
ncbi:MAG: cation/H(+) antiporter [Bacteroidetes bacterium]|nr:MAG: cation/H(+) antiporter [Bacteroidota bacterium]